MKIVVISLMNFLFVLFIKERGGREMAASTILKRLVNLFSSLGSDPVKGSFYLNFRPMIFD